MGRGIQNHNESEWKESLPVVRGGPKPQGERDVSIPLGSCTVTLSPFGFSYESFKIFTVGSKKMAG